MTTTVEINLKVFDITIGFFTKQNEMPQMPCVLCLPSFSSFYWQTRISNLPPHFMVFSSVLISWPKKKKTCVSLTFCCSKIPRKYLKQIMAIQSFSLDKYLRVKTRCRFPIILFDHHRRRRHEWLYDFIMACLVRCWPLFFFVFDDVVITNNSSVYPACQYRFSPSHSLRLLLCFL